MIKEFKYDLQGKELKITIGKVAEQANGACLVQMEDTVLLVTATASDMPREGVDFFPLSCDFEEKLYSVGKIPGGFIKREGRPSEKAVLISRLIDRPLRPLFPEDYRNDVQVIASALSYDNENSIEMLAMIGSSISLSISDIPFMGPTAAVVVAYVDGKYIINPNSEQQSKSKLNLTVAGTKESIMMIESGSNILSEDEIIDGILFAHEEIKSICDFISEIQNEVGLEKVDYEKPNYNQNIVKEIEDFSYDKLNTILRDSNKVTREENQKYFEDTTLEHFLEIYPDDEETIRYAIEKITKYLVRRMIAVEKIRPDGRKLDEIRKLSAEVGVLPRTHGSGLFTRGQTQVLSLTTLGAPSEVQTLDGLTEDEKRYMHQYNFPPYSVGDTKPLRSPGRREIGHGALAERALLPVIPEESDFPYTIRVVSEVLSSNGSSSQASVCGSTLSLLDAGVPLKDSVAGIAMGLIQDENTKDYTILTDIQGLEDHLGDMDFKVAGTKDGITAIQMDIKIDGVSKEILTEALDRAKSARLQILDVMNNCIDKPRENISKYAPRIFSFNINPDKIREIIGPGGKVINKIIDETGVKIDTYDDGRVVVTSDNQENGEKALQMIEDIVKEVEVGETYLGKVTKIMNFGAFVEVLNGKEGLVHISQISNERVNKVEDVLKVGDEILVKVTEIDKQGRINLSRKALLNEKNFNNK
ncbi:polyribonucleotide nucleotidyltransferase [Citroniella saccharovorans]|uniref:Polyribonucleotide nucleotidyltransferase n=1 Tax=Citroniella saccharovorans TaxID=2053367 RepID=A0AAW9MTZ9_9FIRM|nr:polyribonucleotide nucleotidyltransferase [Citroniella saccharovorans]MEB3429626.1 polyribonucleotide nucleotidyltransferase [Citroniella saccharovorans]